MGKILTDEPIESCHREGYLYPHNGAAARIGYSFFLVPPHVRSTPGRRPATLVRSVDEYGNWDTDPGPTEENMEELIQMMPAHNAQYTNPEFRQNA